MLISCRTPFNFTITYYFRSCKFKFSEVVKKASPKDVRLWDFGASVH